MAGRVSLDLIAVYATLFLVCLTQARTPSCEKCALVVEHTGDSKSFTSESPGPAGFVRWNMGPQAPFIDSLESSDDDYDQPPDDDSDAPEDDSSNSFASGLPGAAGFGIYNAGNPQAPTVNSPEPSDDVDDDDDDADAPDDGFSPLAPAPSPNHPPVVPKPRDAGVFDVTAYGAIGDGVTESRPAFLSAWKDACNYNGNSTLLVPNGTFFLGAISFRGPCKYNLQSPKVEIRGVLKAPEVLKTDTWILFKDLRNLELTGGTEVAVINGQGSLTWLQTRDHGCRGEYQCARAPRSLKFIDVSHGIINKIALINSKGYHFSFLRCEYINVHDMNISSPWDSPNTDGIHIGYSRNITIQSSTIGVGDDCVSIGPGTTNISVLNVTCGPGHGISVGSLGKYDNEKDVNGVDVRNCTIKNTTNGVRIKTWHGFRSSKALNINFEDILIVNVSNPIIVDQDYCPGHSCKTSEASHVMLKNISFKKITGTSNTELGTILHCSTAVPCDNIQLIGINLNYTSSSSNNKTQLASLSVKGKIHGFHVYDSKFSPRAPSYTPIDMID